MVLTRAGVKNHIALWFLPLEISPTRLCMPSWRLRCF